MELIAQTAELKCCTYSVHDLGGSCEYMESLHRLGFNLLMTDEVDSLLCAAEEYVYNLLGFDRIQCEAEDVLYYVLIHVIEASRAVQA